MDIEQAAVRTSAYIHAGHELGMAGQSLRWATERIDQLSPGLNSTEQQALEMAMGNVQEVRARLEVIINQMNRAREASRE